MEYYSIMVLDSKDAIILDILKNNAKKTTHQISNETNIPITTVHNRIKKLESSGIIEKYTIWINRKKLGKGIDARLAVKVGRDGDQDEICSKLVHHESVIGAYQVTGEDDIIVKLNVKDVDELHSFIMTEVRALKGVEGTKTLIVLKNFRK
jgi:Lrp/AsnC family leucine-responsive transcriptional regulator